jgi:hypothetical protein
MLKLCKSVSLAILFQIANLQAMPFASAAIEIEVQTTRQSDDLVQKFSHQITRDGPDASTIINFKGSETFPDRSRMITSRDKKEVYFVAADGSECVSWDAGDFSVMLGKILLKMTDRFDATVTNPVLVKIYERPAEPMLGYSVIETQWELDADVMVTLLFKDLSWHVTRTITLWQTEKENFSENPSLIRPRWLKTGYPQLDDLVESSLSSKSRFSMKSEIRQVIDAPIGNPPDLIVTHEVVELTEIETPLPDGFFEAPECQTISKEDLQEQAGELMWLLYGKQIE